MRAAPLTKQLCTTCGNAKRHKGECNTSKISMACLVHCKKEKTVADAGKCTKDEGYALTQVALGYPRTGSRISHRQKRPAARKKRRGLGEETVQGSASCLLSRSTRAFSRGSSTPSAGNSFSASSAADVPARTSASRSLHGQVPCPSPCLIVFGRAPESTQVTAAPGNATSLLSQRQGSSPAACALPASKVRSWLCVLVQASTQAQQRAWSP